MFTSSADQLRRPDPVRLTEALASVARELHCTDDSAAIQQATIFAVASLVRNSPTTLKVVVLDPEGDVREQLDLLAEAVVDLLRTGLVVDPRAVARGFDDLVDRIRAEVCLPSC